MFRWVAKGWRIFAKPGRRERQWISSEWSQPPVLEPSALLTRSNAAAAQIKVPCDDREGPLIGTEAARDLDAHIPPLLPDVNAIARGGCVPADRLARLDDRRRSRGEVVDGEINSSIRPAQTEDRRPAWDRDDPLVLVEVGLEVARDDDADSSAT